MNTVPLTYTPRQAAEAIVLAMLRTAGDYDESKHPRDEKGQWTDSGDSGGFKDTAQGVNTHTESATKALASKTGQPFEAKLYRGVDPAPSGRPSGAVFDRIPSQFAVGEYRTPFPETAATYGRKVLEAPTRLENPFVLTLGERAYYLELKKAFGTRDPGDITRQLVAKGHDGLIVKNVPANRGEISMRDSIEVIVFKGRAAGDYEGHPFHGNQYTDGVGGGDTKEVRSSKDLSADESRLIDNWAWPNAAPEGFGLDYEKLRDPKSEDGKRMTALLERLPVHEGVTYRGLALEDPKDIERLVSTKGYELKLHSSASLDKGTAITFADASSIGGKTKAFVLEFHGRGRSINSLLPEALQSTEEVVITAGTRYKFGGLYHETSSGLDYTRIKLIEVPR